jgi:tRNA pseudouridine55 synthase
MEGFLLIDKPVDWTSFDVVARLRRITGIRKIGHAGTLDPFATGLLVVAIGRGATKRLDEFMSKDKEYVATARLGAVSDTQDLTGEVTETPDSPIPTREQVESAAGKFRGPIMQVPPMYSAKKIGGQRLYDLARAGKEVEREPRPVTIHELEILDYRYPVLKFRVVCSPGTYVRTLAYDLGQALGSSAYLSELRRTKSGNLSVADAKKITELNANDWATHLLPA